MLKAVCSSHICYMMNCLCQCSCFLVNMFCFVFALDNSLIDYLHSFSSLLPYLFFCYLWRIEFCNLLMIWNTVFFIRSFSLMQAGFFCCFFCLVYDMAFTLCHAAANLRFCGLSAPRRFTWLSPCQMQKMLCWRLNLRASSPSQLLPMGNLLASLWSSLIPCCQR